MSKVTKVVIVGSKILGIAQRLRALITSILAMLRCGDDAFEIEAELVQLRKTMTRFESEVRDVIHEMEEKDESPRL